MNSMQTASISKKSRLHIKDEEEEEEKEDEEYSPDMMLKKQ
jgi:hypothetical protein